MYLPHLKKTTFFITQAIILINITKGYYFFVGLFMEKKQKHIMFNIFFYLSAQ
ncbi:hypothetical protein Bresa_03085|uniref:Uncharacterized protein n=1 Tax=Brenneria salicis ATCC 15712 = DSM 30166 TaxID=714314 RepID=A0A366I8C1_9GAMM|nr:hypothetical protein [Brenneria salicis ATCC 15712 = DSM 30166]RBP63728.1 hypothetical protein DES54_11026 [Brenneria salicis ATCC 15712 = DSM 30166]